MQHYDVIIIGTGAGGGTLAYSLADSGKRVLMLERGNWLPREKENWDVREVFLNERYHATEMWYDRNKKPFRPHTNYNVGGNTKVYGSILFRFRDGISQRCATTTASRRRGQSLIRSWHPITRARSSCTPCTASVDLIPPSRTAPTPIHGRR